MKKHILVSLVLIVLAGVQANADASFQIVNTLEHEVVYIFISSEKSEYWGVDILGGTDQRKEVISPQSSLQLRAEGVDNTAVDVLAIDSGGNIYEQWAIPVDAAETSLVTIRDEQRFAQPISIDAFLAPLRVENRMNEPIRQLLTSPGDVDQFRFDVLQTQDGMLASGENLVLWYIVGWEEPLFYHASGDSGSVSDTIWLEDRESLLVLE